MPHAPLTSKQTLPPVFPYHTKSMLVSTELYTSPVCFSIRVHDNDHLPYEGLSPLDIHDEGFMLLICACHGVDLGLLSALPWARIPSATHASGELGCAPSVLSGLLLHPPYRPPCRAYEPSHLPASFSLTFRSKLYDGGHVQISSE